MQARLDEGEGATVRLEYTVNSMPEKHASRTMAAYAIRIDENATTPAIHDTCNHIFHCVSLGCNGSLSSAQHLFSVACRSRAVAIRQSSTLLLARREGLTGTAREHGVFLHGTSSPTQRLEAKP